MTLYLDTSSLVKLYVAEPGSDAVRKLVDDATVVATSYIAYTETRACAYQKLDLGESGVGDGFLEATGGSGERTALVLSSKSRAFADGPGCDGQLFRPGLWVRWAAWGQAACRSYR